MDNPIDRKDPDGYVVITYELRGDKRLCEDKEWFWYQSDSFDYASSYFDDCLSDAQVADLYDTGVYELAIYPAWKGNETEPHDYDESSRVRYAKFKVERSISVEIIS